MLSIEKVEYLHDELGDIHGIVDQNKHVFALLVYINLVNVKFLLAFVPSALVVLDSKPSAIHIKYHLLVKVEENEVEQVVGPLARNYIFEVLWHEPWRVDYHHATIVCIFIFYQIY
jgi:hypothetical protein